jgi:hypothetical protein
MTLICKDCGTVGEATTETPGSIMIEIILWLCFIVPGLIYSIWRSSNRHDVCAKCGGSTILPIDSPIGAKLAIDTGYQAPPVYRGSKSAENFGRAIGRLFRKKKR